MASRVGPYAGAWTRIALEEPRGTPVSTDGSTCIWLQTPSGRFVDIRTPPPGARTLAATKSFAGLAALSTLANSQQRILTWTRRIDLRAPGAPDVGVVVDIDSNTIEELAFLPEDDYREVWQRLEPVSGVFAACDLSSRDGECIGYCVLVGSFWGLAVGRKNSSRGDQLLREFFAGRARTLADTTGTAAHLYAHDHYICAIGRVAPSSDSCAASWTILHSTESALESLSLADTPDALRRRFRLGGLECHEIEGELPAAIRNLLEGASDSVHSLEGVREGASGRDS